MNDDTSKILKLIETVDPSDSAAMDEIDARVHSFRHGLPFMGMSETGAGFIYCRGRAYGFLETPSQYTRSRDALKAIRPAGWVFTIQQSGGSNTWLTTIIKYGSRCVPEKIINDNTSLSSWRQTEELAELHAILQAIAYERATEKNRS